MIRQRLVFSKSNVIGVFTELKMNSLSVCALASNGDILRRKCLWGSTCRLCCRIDLPTTWVCSNTNKLENDINKQSVWAKRCICTLWNTPHPSKHFICFYSFVSWTVFRYPNCRQLDFIYNVHANINCMLHHKSCRVIFLSDRADMFSHYQNRAKGTHSRIKIVKFKVDLCKIVHQTCILLLCKDSNVRWFRKN